MTTQDVARFEFDGQELRTLTVDGETLFCGKDVCTILGYEFPDNTMHTYCRGNLKRHYLETPDGTQEFLFITRLDLCHLIIHSKLATSRLFERWIFEHVLPLIRETSIYMTPEAARRFLQDPQALQYALQALQEEKTKTRTLEQKAEQDAPKVSFADAVAAMCEAYVNAYPVEVKS